MIAKSLLRWSILARFSSANINLIDGIKSDVAGMENISKMPFYQSFREGLNLSL